MRYFISFSILFVLILRVNAQNKESQIYNPNTDAKQQIQAALDIASGENKHILIQVGGNWCPWCIKLHNFIRDHEKLDSLIRADYVFILVNYSKENKNMDVMAELGYPQRFGFPVLVILDGEGKRIHTQNTAYLEEDKTYSEKKIGEFLLSWNMKALDPANYNKK
jgi:thioredoxin-related protein